jgi:hypothetical protein
MCMCALNGTKWEIFVANSTERVFQEMLELYAMDFDRKNLTATADSHGELPICKKWHFRHFFEMVIAALLTEWRHGLVGTM